MMSIQPEVLAGDRKLELVITTEQDGFTVMTGIHRSNHKRSQGGVRFVTRGSVEELAHLAHGMTEKCAAARVPLDGMKALVICPDGIPSDIDRRAQILSYHIERAARVRSGLVFGPDMGCPEAVLDLVVRDRRLLRNVTGLSRANGGLDIDKNGLTAFGVAAAIRAVRPDLGGMTVAIQGFGNVGAPLAGMLDQERARLVAVSNVAGVLIDQDGLDARRLLDLWRSAGDNCLEAYVRHTNARFDPDPSHLFAVPADILVPAARTSVLACAEECGALQGENPDVWPVEDYLASSGVKIIAEAANHPLSFAAERYVEARGVKVLPDAIINCGGMIGCWYEYEHREELLCDPAAYEPALSACRRFTEQRITENVARLKSGEGAASALRAEATAGLT